MLKTTLNAIKWDEWLFSSDLQVGKVGIISELRLDVQLDEVVSSKMAAFIVNRNEVQCLIMFKHILSCVICIRIVNISR